MNNHVMQNFMKPINPTMIRVDSEEVRRQQEQIVLNILNNSPYSLRVFEIMRSAPPLEEFPGYNETVLKYQHRNNKYMYHSRLVSNTCKRLETKGQIVSTLFHGARLYSSPITDNGGTKSM